jgi:hypothetical protein
MTWFTSVFLIERPSKIFYESPLGDFLQSFITTRTAGHDKKRLFVLQFSYKNYKGGIVHER